MTPQRGAIPIELDRPRILFFNAAAVSLLFNRYGMGFAAELYTVEMADGKVVRVGLKSVEALQFFLLAALQADAAAHGETLTLDQVGEWIATWNLATVFTAVIDALTGATYVPPVKLGNAEAAETPASPAATKTPSRTKTPKKTSTLISKTRSGLRLQR